MTIQLTLFTCKKTPLYKSHYMVDVAAFRAKMHYILWQPNLWLYAKTPYLYKAAFLIEVVYKQMSPHT